MMQPHLLHCEPTRLLAAIAEREDGQARLRQATLATLDAALADLQHRLASSEAELAAANRLAADAMQQARHLQHHISWLATATPPTADPAHILAHLASALPTHLNALFPPPIRILDLPLLALRQIVHHAGPLARATCRTLRDAADPPRHLRLPASPDDCPPSISPATLAPLTSLDLRACSEACTPALLPPLAAHCTALCTLCCGPLPCPSMLTSLAPLAPTLRTLSLASCGLTHHLPNPFAPLSHLTALQELALDIAVDPLVTPTTPHPPAARILAPVLTLTTLTSLAIHIHCDISIDASRQLTQDALALVASHLPRLAHLRLPAEDFTPRMAACLATMTALTALEAAHDIRCDPRGTLFAALAALPRLAALTVHIRAPAVPHLATMFGQALPAPPTRASTPAAPPAHASATPSRPRAAPPSPLHSLCLHVHPLLPNLPGPTFSLDPFLDILRPRPDVTHLEIHSYEATVAATPACLAHLAAAAPALRTLHLRHCLDPAATLGPLAALPHLTSLVLPDARPASAASLALLTNLQHLDTTCLPADDLAALGALTRLTSLRLELNKLADRLPELLWALLPLRRLQVIRMQPLPSAQWLERPGVTAALLHLPRLRLIDDDSGLVFHTGYAAGKVMPIVAQGAAG